MQIDYTDIFYLHRYDTETPATEVADCLRYLLDQGLILYVVISNFPLSMRSDLPLIVLWARVP